MYSLTQFGAMISDGVRMSAYRQALASVITPQSVVLDLGAGTGIMGMLALRYGARRVYAVEPADAIHVAREAAAANGLSERMVFIQDASTKVSLPEPVDLIVEDMRGTLPWHRSHLPDLIDARRRFLKPGGRIIAARDTGYCAVVEAEESYRWRVEPWQTPVEGLDLGTALRYVTSSAGSIVGDVALLTPGAPWASIDYASVESPHARGALDVRAERDGTAHGLLLWFESELVPGVAFSSASGESDTVYGRRFLPWPHPVSLRRGARISVDLRADLVGEDYVWTWESCIRDDADAATPEVRFRQSTFLGNPVTRESLARRAAGHVPQLNAEGRMTRFVLERMQGHLPLAEIAAQLAAAHPQRFGSGRDALDFVASLSGSYSD